MSSKVTLKKNFIRNNACLRHYSQNNYNLDKLDYFAYWLLNIISSLGAGGRFLENSDLILGDDGWKRVSQMLVFAD